jgi:hypothetical protein
MINDVGVRRSASLDHCIPAQVHRWTHGLWPNPAVRVSLAGYPAEKFMDGHYWQEPTRDGFFR